MFALLLALSVIASANVIGIDIGTEYFKVSIIKPGVKLAIVENSHTKRKTPTAISFYQDERFFGIDAENLATKSPETTLTHIPRCTGVAFNDTSVTQRLENEYFQYKIVENEERASISYQVKDKVFTNEEILAQVFEHIKSMVDIQAGAGANLKDTVITVPAFWNRAQRASIMGAASAAKLKVLNLIHENTAAALYYGADRMDNETDHYAVFYNLGASNLQVSLAKYSTGTKVITKSENKTVENIEILAHAWDSSLGGRNLDAALVSHILSQNSKIQRTPRAYAKLLKQARKTKETLSANRETSFVIESLLEGGDDLKVKLTREDFEAAWEHLVPQLTAPIQSVLDQSGLTKSDIHTYEIIGGAVRVPKVQEAIKEFTGVEELGWHLNGDEAMANGAALSAGNFTSTVQVRPIWLADISSDQFIANFTDPTDPTFEKSAVIFKTNSKLGTKKKISFSHDSDVLCQISYGSEAAIVEYNITEVAENARVATNNFTNYFMFQLDMNGIPTLLETESKYIKTKESKNKDTGEMEEKNVTVKLPLKFKANYVELPAVIGHTETHLISKSLQQYKEEEDQRRQLAELRNELETYIYQAKDKRTEDEFNALLSDKEKSNLDATIEGIQSWFDMTDLWDLAAYNEKLRAIKDQMDKYVERERELGTRDREVRKAYKELEKLYTKMVELNTTKEFVEIEKREEAFNKLNDTISWLDEKVDDQQKLPPWEQEANTLKNLSNKVAAAEKKVSKIEKAWKPKDTKKTLDDIVKGAGIEDKDAAKEDTPKEDL